jgi:1-aminocyclopropane-1-carboxylate deaminase/D-cysteine desulfhydrase-like pyridoxal-dependent ACC family enzyme
MGDGIWTPDGRRGSEATEAAGADGGVLLDPVYTAKAMAG